MCTYVCACVYVGLFLNSVQPRCALAHQLCQALSLLWAHRVDRNHLDPDLRKLLLVRDAPTPQVCWGQQPRGTLMGGDSWRVSRGKLGVGGLAGERAGQEWAAGFHLSPGADPGGGGDWKEFCTSNTGSVAWSEDSGTTGAGRWGAASDQRPSWRARHHGWERDQFEGCLEVKNEGAARVLVCSAQRPWQSGVGGESPPGAAGSTLGVWSQVAAPSSLLHWAPSQAVCQPPPPPWMPRNPRSCCWNPKHGQPLSKDGAFAAS